MMEVLMYQVWIVCCIFMAITMVIGYCVGWREGRKYQKKEDIIEVLSTGKLEK